VKGRFIVFSFSLNEKQWDNFSNFFTSNNTGILSEDILNKDCKLEEGPYEAHSVLLIEVKEKYLRFLNSWGSNWGDGGTFKLKKPSILTPYGTTNSPKFYDIFFYENELSSEEQLFYSKNIGTIHEILNDFGEASINKIRENIKSLPKEFKFKCKRCGKGGKITKSEPFFYNYSPHFYLNTLEVKIELDKKNYLYKIYCPFWKNPKEIKGSLRELLLFLNLLYDGNEDFDINFQEKYYMHVNRVELHNNFKENIDNESDKCSIGSENHTERKIDPHFKKEIKRIIYLEMVYL